MMRIVAIACALAWGGSAVLAQSAEAGAARDFVVSGVVVNARTGQAVPGATMSLSGSGTRVSLADVETDGEGNFRFEHVPKGRFELIARRHGYVQQAFQQHPGGVSTAIVTGEGKPTTDLRFTLEQMASIHGTITESSGDPVPQARVMLFRQTRVDGVEKMVRAGQAMANEAGDYEAGRLQPGSYAVCVSGRPWYAWTPRAELPGDDRRRPLLDVAYPTTCYPGATDPAQAELMTVAAGDRVELPIVLHAMPAVHVTVRLPDGDGGRGMNIPMLETDMFGAMEPAQPSSLTWHGGGHAQHPAREMVMSVAPGQYKARFGEPNGRTDRLLSVDATGESAMVDPATATQEGAVRGTVKMANGTPLPNASGVRLVPEQGDGRGAGVEQNGEFNVDGLPAGRYRLTVVSATGRLGLAQVTANGAPLRGDVLTVGSEPLNVNLSVTQGTATVAGEVKRGETGASGVFLVLVPDDRGAPMMPNQSDSDGTFEFRNVLPGSYTAVAIEDGWALNWSSRDVLRKYLAAGQRITVPRGAQTVSLPSSLMPLAK